MIYSRKFGFGITFIPQHADNENRTYFKITIIPLTYRNSKSSEITVTERKYVHNRK